MSARKLVYRLMVCAPAMFLAGLGVHARSLTTDFDFQANDPTTERSIKAYVPYLRDSHDFMVSTAPRPSIEETRVIADHWIAGYREGELKPLAPVSYLDTSSDGAKSLIFDVERKICLRLMSSIREAVAKDDRENALMDLTRVVRISNVLKDSDFLSLFNCVWSQRRALEQVRPLIPTLSPRQCRQLRNLLPELRLEKNMLEHMAGRSRSLFLEYRVRTGSPPLSIENTQLLTDLCAMVGDGDKVALRQARTRLMSCQDNELPNYSSSLQMAIDAKAGLDKELDKTVAALSMKGL